VVLLTACLAVAGAGCTSIADRLARADQQRHDLAFGSALGQYRAVGQDACSEGSEGDAACCRALLGEAVCSLELGERASAIHAAERARRRCPHDLEARRLLHEVRRPEAVTPVPPAYRVPLAIEVDPRGLPRAARVTWLAVFVAGVPVGTEAIELGPGTHEVEAELALAPPAGREEPPMLLHDRGTLTVSGAGAPGGEARLLRLTVDASPTPRLTLTIQPLVPLPIGPMAKLPPEQALIFLQKIGPALRESAPRPRVPPEHRRRGPHWEMPVTLCVDPSGNVTTLRLASTGPGRHPRVDGAVLDAVRAWRYGVFRLNGVAQAYCHDEALDLAR
jgi:hypothetical protein